MKFHGGDIYSHHPGVLDFSSNINPLGVPESFRQALLDNLDDFTCYPDPKYRALREAIAKYLNFPSPELIIPGNGAVEIIYQAIMALDIHQMINLSPTFSEYAWAARQKGVPVLDLKPYDENFSRLDTPLILDEATPSSLVVLCNPNNPTGTLISREQVLDLAGKIGERKSYLFVDEAFIEFTQDYPENSLVPELKNLPHVLVIRAATKFFGMPGIRLGFGITKNQQLAEKIDQSMDPWHVNTAAVIAACTLYQDQEYIRAARHWAKTEREFFWQRLQEIEGLLVYPSTVNFHLVKIKEELGLDAWALKDLMLAEGVLIRTPDGFYGLSPYHFRLAVKDRRANEKVLEALQRVINKKDN